jgi:hypothetical protein
MSISTVFMNSSSPQPMVSMLALFPRKEAVKGEEVEMFEQGNWLEW